MRVKFIILSVFFIFYILTFLCTVSLGKAAKMADETLEKITKKSTCGGLKN